MRHLLTFDCGGAELAGSLDEAPGSTGLLMVTGGSQTRVGSHRMIERLAARLAADGIPCFRYDRRGVGDSSGADPGFRGSGPDLAGALSAFRAAQPQLTRVIGFGLCDGATALALCGDGLGGLILANPWLVEAEAGQPPPAAIRARYRERLLSRAGWRDLLTGAISYRKLFGGLLRIVRSAEGNLAQDVARALRRHSAPVRLILARRDATAIAAEAEWRRPQFAPLRARAGKITYLDTDSHTFARPGDEQALASAVRAALRQLG